jgi:type IV secretory pathway TrbD component
MNQMRTIPLHQSLIRPILLAGGERKLSLLNGIMAFALIFGVGSVYAAGVGVFLATVLQWGLVQLAKKDAQFSEVYVRHVSYQTYYPAQSSFTAPLPIIKYLP